MKLSEIAELALEQKEQWSGPVVRKEGEYRLAHETMKLIALIKLLAKNHNLEDLAKDCGIELASRTEAE